MYLRLVSLSVVLLAILLPVVVWAQDYEEIIVPRVEENGRVLIQMRPIFEALDWTVDWRATNQEIYAHAGPEDTMTMWVNRRYAIVNGKEYTLDVTPRLIDGSTYVPIRFVAESTGLTVDYQGDRVVIKDAEGNTLVVHLEEDV